LQLRDIIRVVGVVSHRQAIVAQRNASILLVIIGKGEGRAILTGKIFEYLGAGRPILALVPHDGEAADLIRKTNTGVIIDPDDTNAIARALRDSYNEWRAGNISYSPRNNKINRYSRLEQARQLGDLFEQIT
jgi:glycosyltransferase involved in cell wall biosynthesis